MPVHSQVALSTLLTCLVASQGFVFAFGSRMHPFVASKAFRSLTAACRESGEGQDALMARLQDPGLRAEIIAECSEVRLSEG